MTQLSDRIKGKSIALFMCDECSDEFHGNYYVVGKKDIHLCRSCSCKAGWKKKHKDGGNTLTDKQKLFVVCRDNKTLDSHFPKSKTEKIIIRCSDCGDEYKSNNYDFLDKFPLHRCVSCAQKDVWSKNHDRLAGVRKTEEYRSNMSTAIKNSDKHKACRVEVGKKHTKYWDKVRGFTKEELWDEWTLYKKTVYRMTEKVYRANKNIVNPNNVSRNENHLDHMFSVLEGFKRNIPPYIMSDVCNLEIIKSEDNLSKGSDCSITEEELMELFFNKEERRSSVNL